MDSQLLNRVPPEVWTLIFENLWREKDYNSLYNCYKTGVPSWISILENERTKFLFPLIIHNFPSHLPHNQILNLRLCCSTWKSSVDTNHLLSPTSWGTSTTLPLSTPHLRNVHEPEDEWFRNGLSPPRNHGATFWLPQQIDLFLLQFSNLPATQNPFPTRTIKLIENEQFQNSLPQNLALYQKFEILLEKFGHHIWKCIYYCDGGLAAANLGILKILKCAPNLKCLTIKKTLFWGDVTGNPEEEIEIAQSLKWLNRQLPLLPQLTSLNLFLDCHNLANAFLFWYAKQLISLQLEVEAIDNTVYFNDPRIWRESLENLKSLKLTGSYGDSSLLDRLSKFDLPVLQRLSLNYNDVGDKARNFKSVIWLINKCRLSLEELRLPFNLFGLKEQDMIRCYQENREEMGIGLDKVKWLAVPYNYLVEYPNLFQLILQKFTESLEHLHFMNYDKHLDDKELEKMEFEENLKPIWRDLGFKALRKITVENERTLKNIFWSEGENTNYYNG